MDYKNLSSYVHCCSVTILLSMVFAPTLAAQSDHNVTAAMVENWMTELSNWGRWEEGDQLGALNLITADNRVAAARLVQTGVSVSLAHNYSVDSNLGSPPPFDQSISMLNILLQNMIY